MTELLQNVQQLLPAESARREPFPKWKQFAAPVSLHARSQCCEPPLTAPRPCSL